MKFTGKSLAIQVFLGIVNRRLAGLIGLAVLCAVALPAQVITFLGAQRTVVSSGLSGPNGTAVDSFGNLYIADTGHNRILKIAPNGTQTVVSVAPLTLNAPLAVALDAAGNLYATDGNNNRVVKVPVGGGAATAFASVFTPDGLAVDSSGNVFVADNEDGTIVKITSGGATSTFETGLEDPIDVAVDAAGNVYLADGTLSSIVKFPPNGGDGANVGTSLTSIAGVAVDASGNVYVAESGEGTLIVEITPAGTQTTLATSGLDAATYFAVDSNYDLFIADNATNNVIEFSTISVPLGFANVCQVGAPAPCSQTATLQFASEISFATIGMLTTGSTGLDFSQSGGTCGGETSPCTVVVTFAPTAPGLRAGAVAIADECLGQVLSVPIYGTGNGANAVFTPPLASGPIPNDGFSDPVAVAVAGSGVFDGGPIFIADDVACVVWELGEEFDFVVYAGNFTCGYAGDGGSASGSAELGHPEDLTLDGAGNVYIADTANGVIRKVDRNGTIATVAGNNGLAGGFSGDGGPATSAALHGPNGIALDSAGNLYIADTNNNRIRKVDLGGTISTVAGSSSAGYSGDGGPATSAKLSEPFGVRVDAAGNLFIADTDNNVIRRVGLNGTITTVAGNFELGAGYSGDNGPATSARLASPVYVSLDAAGELYIADQGNGVIRRVNGAGTISTYPTGAAFPSDLSVDPTGNIAVADPENGAILLFARTIPAGLDFGSENVNTGSVPQDETVTNIGNQPLNFSMIVPPTGFNLSGPDTSCSTDSTLNIGLDCILGIVFDPATADGFETQVVLTDNSLGPAAASMQTVGVTGTGVAVLTPTTTTLVAMPSTPVIAGQSVSLIAMVSPAPTGGTPGSVEFCLGGVGSAIIRGSSHPASTVSTGWRRRWAMSVPGPQVPNCNGGTLLGIVAVASGWATFTTTSLALGDNRITALYEGNDTLAGSISPAVTVTIDGLTSTTTTLTAAPNPAAAGQSVTFTATVMPTPTGGSLGTVDFCLNGSDLDGIRNARQSVVRSQSAGHARNVISQNVSSCGSGTLLGTSSVSAGGIATLSVNSLTQGPNSITAVYSGNSTLSGSTSATVTETINGAAATVTTLSATPNPGFDGQSVMLTGTVAPVPTGSSLGTIAFCESSEGPSVRRRSAASSSRPSHPAGSSIVREGQPSPCGGDALLGSSSVMADGTATLAVTTFVVGDNNVYAVYSGASGFTGSTSDTLDEAVGATYTVTAPQTPFPIAEGGSVQITITVPPLGGSYTSVVTLVASGLPPRAIATFNPPTVTPGAEGEQTIMTIQLEPTAAQRTATLPAVPRPPVGPLTGILVLLVAASFHKRRMPRLARALALAAIVSAAAFTLAACNGGFAGASTPAGQYVVTVTGTSGSLHPSTTVTVVVQ